MLYIKFTVTDQNRFEDFKKLFDHMCMVRSPNYKEPEENIDIGSLTDEEEDDYFSGVLSKVRLSNELIPEYANHYLAAYYNSDNQRSPMDKEDMLSIFNYLEYGFEVNMDKLEQINSKKGIVEFSTGNYPFGGMDRFLIVLKAFGLIPFECYNGFELYAFRWTTEYEHEADLLPEKKEAYLNERRAERS